MSCPSLIDSYFPLQATWDERRGLQSLTTLASIRCYVAAIMGLWCHKLGRKITKPGGLQAFRALSGEWELLTTRDAGFRSRKRLFSWSIPWVLYISPSYGLHTYIYIYICVYVCVIYEYLHVAFFPVRFIFGWIPRGLSLLHKRNPATSNSAV